jgi:hypothetical protein
VSKPISSPKTTPTAGRAATSLTVARGPAHAASSSRWLCPTARYTAASSRRLAANGAPHSTATPHAAAADRQASPRRASRPSDACVIAAAILRPSDAANAAAVTTLLPARRAT